MPKLQAMRLPRGAELVAGNGHEALTYFGFPSNHWRQIRTNNPLERIIREIRRRRSVVGGFPDCHGWACSGHHAEALAEKPCTSPSGLQAGIVILSKQNSTHFFSVAALIAILAITRCVLDGIWLLASLVDNSITLHSTSANY